MTARVPEKMWGDPRANSPLRDERPASQTSKQRLPSSGRVARPNRVPRRVVVVETPRPEDGAVDRVAPDDPIDQFLAMGPSTEGARAPEPRPVVVSRRLHRTLPRRLAHFLSEKESSQYSSMAPRRADDRRTTILPFNGNGRGRWRPSPTVVGHGGPTPDRPASGNDHERASRGAPRYAAIAHQASVPSSPRAAAGRGSQARKGERRGRCSQRADVASSR